MVGFYLEKCPVEIFIKWRFNYAMRKLKIFTTILILYEFGILTILQIPNYCVRFFSIGFCDSYFRYFLMAIIIPVLFLLIAWWWPDISRKMCKNCQCETKQEEIKDALKENIGGVITSALVAGIQKFIVSHPKTVAVFNDVLGDVTKTKKAK